jgi:hypothetical protein
MISGFHRDADERSALFWGITQRRVVFYTGVSGQIIGPIFKCQEVLKDCLTLEDGADSLSRKPVQNHRYIPE